MNFIEKLEIEKINESKLLIYSLGQSGYRLSLKNLTVYIDPYLTDYIENPLGLNEKNMQRSFPTPIKPQKRNVLVKQLGSASFQSTQLQK